MHLRAPIPQSNYKGRKNGSGSASYHGNDNLDGGCLTACGACRTITCRLTECEGRKVFALHHVSFSIQYSDLIVFDLSGNDLGLNTRNMKSHRWHIHFSIVNSARLPVIHLRLNLSTTRSEPQYTFLVPGKWVRWWTSSRGSFWLCNKEVLSMLNNFCDASTPKSFWTATSLNSNIVWWFPTSLLWVPESMTAPQTINLSSPQIKPNHKK
jgi:hypothetical protein